MTALVDVLPPTNFWVKSLKPYISTGCGPISPVPPLGYASSYLWGLCFPDALYLFQAVDPPLALIFTHTWEGHINKGKSITLHLSR
jgi:hypothetical protein